ncbi:MAG TPA: alkaline shock response membrane anchor protein AmaP [Firmicutes bacterium]|jgi:uncharacterized alkaline shock family protein YloU|nr:alkaline shock response membrane anchor protein AmaP [Bacillota bacterium]
MWIFDRILLTIYAVAGMVLSGGIVLWAAGWERPLQYLNRELTYNPNSRWLLGLLGFVFLLGNFRFLTVAWQRRRGRRAVVHQTKLGDVRISLAAVEHLISRAARGVPGVREAKTRVAAGNEGLLVALRTSALPQVSIPETSQRIQDVVRRQLQDVVGIPLERIEIEVDAIAGEGRRTRVE